MEKEKKANNVDNTEKLISESKEFIKTLNLDFEKVKQEKVIFIDYRYLEKYSKDLADRFISNPDETLQILETAVDDLIPGSCSRVRFFNPPESSFIRIDDIRAKNLHQLISIKGYMVQASEIRPQVVIAKFECPKSKTIISVLQIEKKFIKPSKCPCGYTGEFTLLSKEMVDAQRLIISESPEIQNDGIPSCSSLQVFLQEDLIAPDKDIFNKFGKKVEVTGTLHEIPVNLESGEMSTRFDLAIEANNIIFEKDDDVIRITDQDEKEILALAKDHDVFEKLAANVAPGIWGYGDIKKALVLQLFGGARGNINTLIIGDPGVGKIKTLKAISDIALGGLYVDGVMMSEEEIAQELSSRVIKKILPGKKFIALSNFNNLDFFEGKAIKLIKKQIMEGNSIIASGIPKFGRFEPFQTISQQIDIPPTLINLFDLIFILRDLPDKYKDEAIATHILKLYEKKSSTDMIERDLFRKYLAYAKIKASPKLNEDAIKAIREFYVGLRNAPGPENDVNPSIPISARQLETLAKLAEAHARVRLSNEATKEDAELAISIIKYYMMQVGYDPERKSFDIDRIAGVSASQRKSIILVMKNLEELEEKLGKFIPLEELEDALKGKIKKEVLDDSIQKLIASGDIFIPRKGFIQRI